MTEYDKMRQEIELMRAEADALDRGIADGKEIIASCKRREAAAIVQDCVNRARFEYKRKGPKRYGLRRLWH